MADYRAGEAFTFVRKGEYELLMTYKTSGRRVPCLCFHEDRAISKHLIHDAYKDSHLNLAGCIAPGLTSDENGIKGSAEAMDKVFSALGGFTEGRKKTIAVGNNVHGTETKDEWIRRQLRPVTPRLDPRTSTLLNNALLSAHYEPVRLPASARRSAPLVACATPPAMTIAPDPAGPPDSRRRPFLRDAVLDPGGVRPSRLTTIRILPSLLGTNSASARF